MLCSVSKHRTERLQFSFLLRGLFGKAAWRVEWPLEYICFLLVLWIFSYNSNPTVLWCAALSLLAWVAAALLLIRNVVFVGLTCFFLSCGEHTASEEFGSRHLFVSALSSLAYSFFLGILPVLLPSLHRR